MKKYLLITAALLLTFPQSHAAEGAKCNLYRGMTVQKMSSVLGTTDFSDPISTTNGFAFTGNSSKCGYSTFAASVSKSCLQTHGHVRACPVISFSAWKPGQSTPAVGWGY